MSSLATFLSVMSAIIVSFAYAAHRLYIKPYPPQEEPIKPPVSPVIASPSPPQPNLTPVPKPDLIKACALAQQAFEGWWQGSTSFSRNNPGNIKGFDGKFLNFPTYSDGFAYLENYIRNVGLGKNKNYPKDCTIYQYTHIYTADREPSPTNYATAIAKAVGLPITAKMSQLLT